MNLKDILELTAGKRLDALVAEKVMGWKYDYSDELRMMAWFAPHGERMWFPASTSIATAWEVVEKLDKHMMIQRKVNGEFVVRFHDYRSQAVSADKAPEAICKAALIAVLNGIDIRPKAAQSR